MFYYYTELLIITIIHIINAYYYFRVYNLNKSSPFPSDRSYKASTYLHIRCNAKNIQTLNKVT